VELLDLHDIAARFLSSAISGISATRISEVESGLKSVEANHVLHMLLNRKLLELGESSVYWTTTEGIKFLDIRFNLERMLKAQSSLV
jgi:predicted transcriptional regulator